MKDLTKNEEILLLTIWELQDEAYGVRIRKHISELIGKDFTYGNLYSALNQLTKGFKSIPVADLNQLINSGMLHSLDI